VRKKEKESRQGAQESPYCEEGRKTEKELRRDKRARKSEIKTKEHARKRKGQRV